MLRWLPYVLFGVAVLSALAYERLEGPEVDRAAPAVFVIAVGGALGCWGLENIAMGRIRGRRVYVHRSDHPFVFWALVVGSRILPFLVLIPAGLYSLWTD